MSDGSSAVPYAKQKAGSPYAIQRRTQHKRSGAPLSGYAVDVTIRVNGGEAYFLQDHNSDRNTMPFNNREELGEFLYLELKRHHQEHFGQ